MGQDDTLSSIEFAAAANITYRQVDHWARLGLLGPLATGSGRRRRIPRRYIDAARTAGTIGKALHSNQLRDIITHILTHHDDGHLDLGHGVHITWPTTQRSLDPQAEAPTEPHPQKKCSMAAPTLPDGTERSESHQRAIEQVRVLWPHLTPSERMEWWKRLQPCSLAELGATTLP